MKWLTTWQDRMCAGGLLSANFRSPGHARNEKNATPISKATLFTPRDLFWAFAGDKGFITNADFQQVVVELLVTMCHCAGNGEAG